MKLDKASSRCSDEIDDEEEGDDYEHAFTPILNINCSK